VVGLHGECGEKKRSVGRDDPKDTHSIGSSGCEVNLSATKKQIWQKCNNDWEKSEDNKP